MALQVTAQQREFILHGTNGKKVTLTDIDPDKSPEQVLDHYLGLYPELTTATIQGPIIKKDRVQYEFSPQLGDKG